MSGAYLYDNDDLFYICKKVPISKAVLYINNEPVNNLWKCTLSDTFFIYQLKPNNISGYSPRIRVEYQNLLYVGGVGNNYYLMDYFNTKYKFYTGHSSILFRTPIEYECAI